MSPGARRYVFSPLEQRGVLAGLRPGQLALVGGVLVVDTALVRRAPQAPAVVVAGLLLVAAVAAAFVPVRGRQLDQWAPPVLRHATRRAQRATVTRPLAARRRAPAVLPTPAAFRALRFAEVRGPGGRAVGTVEDRASGSMTAVLAARGESFTLLDGAEKERRLDAWAAVLAGLAREDGAVRSLTWVHRTVPGDAGELSRQLARSSVLPADSAPRRAYAELVSEAGPVGQEHESYVALTVRRRARSGASPESVLLRELRLLEGQLRSADVDVDRVLSLRDLGALLRTAFDPSATTDIGRRAALHPELTGPLPAAAWPAATEGGWRSWRTDDLWHATLWIAEWPRTEVGTDFLAPLLLQAGTHRRVAVVMSPLAPSAGFREAEAARTAQAADEHLRHRAGFLATARRRREAEGIARREAELSDGHAAYRFSGYVTVTSASPEALETAVGEVTQAAHQCRLELRRLFGVQDLAFTWTLPLGQGLAGG